MGSINLLEARRNILMSQPHLTSASANPLTFQTDISANLKDCKIYLEPVQEGSGDPSPDNVRPISGWDGVSVYTSKRNLLITDGITFTGSSYINKDGNIASSRYYKRSNPIPCSHIAGKTVTFNTVIESGGSSIISVGFYSSDTIDSDHAVLLAYKGWTSDETITVTIPLTAKYMVITLNNSNTLDGKYIVEGTNPLDEVDTPTAITIPCPQTIYGGYVDLVKGEVVEEWKSEMMSSYTWTNHSTSSSISRWKCPDIPVKPASTKNDAFHGISDRLLPIAYNGSWNSYYRISPSSDGYSNTFVILPAMTAQEANDFFATAHLCYELATPNTHQLTPQVIKTLKGINNIWSDANGNIEIKFWKH